jgi:iron complex outermembrane receptor protein
LLALGAPLAAQEPVRADSAQVLPEITVTVTRTEEPLSRVPQAVGVLNQAEITRGQQTLGLEEAFTNIPGVFVANRYNFSLDQRLSIRGAGSRSNFGVRGVKVLLDGIPQTLPDGQSQLSNVEFAALDRVEVLRGPSSAIYGNASGGVLALQSQAAGPEAFAQHLRLQGGSYGSRKWQALSSVRAGDVSGTLSVSRFVWDGFRQQSAADNRLLNLGINWAASPVTTVDVRFLASDAPVAENPGALTEAEWEANPDSAAPNNIRRGADKDVSQEQASVSFLRRIPEFDAEFSASAFGLHRDLQNPLATPPPGPQGADAPIAGTFVAIQRKAGGFRLATAGRLGKDWKLPRLSAGVDFQRLSDDRQNYRSLAGVATDSVLLDQAEDVTEIGPYVQANWTPNERLVLTLAGRYDWVKFSVTDLHLTDGVDNSGSRALDALTGTAGASYFISEALVPYVNVATAFETPTTTELANQPGTSGGFNDQLDPQRTRSFELGVRGRVGGTVEYTAAGYLSRVTDAIVQFREVGGRAYFTNAGETQNNGLELGLSVQAMPALRVFGSFTYSNFTFKDYILVNGAVADTLDGNRLAGVPRYFTRIGVRAEPFPGWAVDLDHTLTSSVPADDANAIWVDNWGAGVTNVRLSWFHQWKDINALPFIGVYNLWNRRYISSVTINGAFGRVLEPAPLRNVYVGVELGFRTRS